MSKRSKPQAATVAESGRTSKEEILEAALTVFARDGFEGASMPKIAKMAQVAPPLGLYLVGVDY